MTDKTVDESSLTLLEMLPYTRMNLFASELAERYAAADPFPHVVVDGLFDESVLDRVLYEFPGVKDANWIEYDNAEEIKLESNDETDLPVFTRHLLHLLNSGTFIKFLERITGIKHLIGDPHFDGGGLHQVLPGGKLAIHADFSRHSKYTLHRRVNLLLYLNKNWKDEYGGDLELWDRTMSRRVKTIAPIYNRTVIFSTSRYAYHGHPDPLACPTGMTRKSLALYYYSVTPDIDSEGMPRHGTLFQSRPGETFSPTTKQFIRDMIPPVIWRALTGARREYPK